jgi:hypothetical protein
VGDTFPSTDGCNTCSCGQDGEVACTDRACVDSGPSALSYYRTCGDPVCGPASDQPTGQPPCTTERAGDSCDDDGRLCDPGLGCGVNLLCTASDPTMQPGGCPISRARYKRDIRYLSDRDLEALTDELLSTKLARFRYRTEAAGLEQLGFLLDDVAPSSSVEGDHVNLYGYTSMAVAALQVQAKQVRALDQELAELRNQLDDLRLRCAVPASSLPE